MHARRCGGDSFATLSCILRRHDRLRLPRNPDCNRLAFGAALGKRRGESLNRCSHRACDGSYCGGRRMARVRPAAAWPRRPGDRIRLLRCMSPLLAKSGHRSRAGECLRFGHAGTSDGPTRPGGGALHAFLEKTDAKSGLTSTEIDPPLLRQLTGRAISWQYPKPLKPQS